MIKKNLLDKNRFKAWESQKRQRLKKLSLKKAISLQERLLSSSFLRQWRRNFLKDEPLSLKNSLKKR